MTRQDITLPEMGEGVEGATVVGILVEVGDTIDAEQSIVELETDKAVAEVPSPAGGKVVEIHAEVDQELNIGDKILTLETADGDSDDDASDAEADDAEADADVASEQASEDENSDDKTAAEADADEPAQQPAEPKTEQKTADSAKPAAADQKQVERRHPPVAVPGEEISIPVSSAHTKQAAVTTGGADDNPAANIPAAPMIHRLAGELGVDLTGVTGSGAGGWITEEDVRAAAGQATAAAAPAAPADESAADSWGQVRREKISQIRKTIAAKMRQSHTSTVAVTNFDDADITELDKFRRSHKDEFAADGITLSLLPLVVKALVAALKRHPIMNASLDMESGEIIYKQYISIGIAVDTPRGLVVPVLRNADRMSVVEISAGINSLITSVRNGSFGVNDLQGGTFTLSNLGSVGGRYSTPIINHPQSAILLTGRGGDIPVVHDGQVVVRRMMPLSLSYDHQLIDGADAARFLGDLKEFLASPAKLLAR